MGPKPINLTLKNTSVWILLIKLYGTNANFTIAVNSGRSAPGPTWAHYV